jgi:hypothetical protein
MMAWTSPAGLTTRSMPLRIGLSPIGDARVQIRMSNMGFIPPTSFEADREQLLRLDREFHRQLLQHVLAEAVDDQRHGASSARAGRAAGNRTIGLR